MINLIKKILKEEFNNKREEKFYQLFKSYVDKRYEAFMSTRYDQYSDSIIMVYRFTPIESGDMYYDNSFDMKKDGTLFNTPATLELKDRFGLSLKELGKFLLRYIEDYK